MAVTVAQLTNGPFWKSFSVIATADADAAATIQHDFGVIPEHVILTPADAVARLSLWIRTSKSASTVVVGKTTAVGSGGANVQLIVHLLRTTPTQL